MSQTLKDKRALVTGGSRGIGAAIVQRLAREGARVALTYVSKPDEANKTVAAAEALGVPAIAIRASGNNAQTFNEGMYFAHKHALDFLAIGAVFGVSIATVGQNPSNFFGGSPPTQPPSIFYVVPY